MDNKIAEIAVNPARAGVLAGLGTSTIYAAIRSGELRKIKVGNRTLLLVDDLRAWLLSKMERQA